MGGKDPWVGKYEEEYLFTSMLCFSLAVFSVPARIVDIGYAQALEWQLVENSQRMDVHPYKEAQGFQRLLDILGYDVAALVEKSGKSASHIYARLSLLQVIPTVAEAFIQERVAASHANLLARLPQESQTEAFDQCWRKDWQDKSRTSYPPSMLPRVYSEPLPVSRGCTVRPGSAITYTDSSGNQQPYRFGYAQLNIASNFQCKRSAGSSSPEDYAPSSANGVSSHPWLTQVTLPGANPVSYTLAYEPTAGKSGYYTGRVSKITLPSGAFRKRHEQGIDEFSTSSDNRRYFQFQRRLVYALGSQPSRR